MTESDAEAIVQRMTKVWRDWAPTPELVSLWVGVFAPFEYDTAWKALELLYGHAPWPTPKPSDFQREIGILLGVSDLGVHAGDTPGTCPLFILEQVTGTRKPRTSTWMCPHGCPDSDADMLKQATYKLHEMERLYPRDSWIIADARSPAADASEYVKQLSWRLTNKARPEAPPAGQEPQAEEESSIPF